MSYKDQLYELDELFIRELCRDTSSQSFSKTIDNLLTTFLEEVENRQTTAEVADHLFDVPRVKSILENACNGIKGILDLYNKGSLYDVNKEIKGQFTNSGSSIDASHNFPITQVKKDSKWFRIRKNENEEFERKDLFHVPFEKRNKIGTYRYSIPGYPALYLGSTLFCSWLETDCPQDFSFSILRVMSDIEVFDLRFFPEIENPNQAVNYLLSYPYKLACSVVASNKNNYVPEYVFPQLMIHFLLRHARIKGKVLGLLYTSTKHYATLDNNNCRSYDNLVVPSIDVADKGYCKKLVNLFELSNPQQIGIPQMIENAMFENYIQEKPAEYQKVKNENQPNLYVEFLINDVPCTYCLINHTPEDSDNRVWTGIAYEAIDQFIEANHIKFNQPEIVAHNVVIKRGIFRKELGNLPVVISSEEESKDKE